jgi:hypothetical protein
MKVTILESKPIPDNFEQIRFDRRRLLKSGGLLAIASVFPQYTIARQANAQWLQGVTGLISAAVSAVELYRSLWHVREPTEGTITFINYNNYLKDGDIMLRMLGAMYGNMNGNMYGNMNGNMDETMDGNMWGNIENERRMPFAVPANRQIAYGFTDGPFGLSPGSKIMEGITGKGAYRTNLTIEL